MPVDPREQLKSIRTFPSLRKYLRDEMDWPIGSDSFEKITFKFTPEELGIDSKNAAKIQEIHRLRPLSPNQPWGVFFIKFEPKRLPVVALRRILNQVTLKKRASSNSADRKAWEAEDLLFVSNYGEGEDRQITLAHFHQNPEKKDLPVLKVLGWDDKDTALHLDDVADKLTNKLSWPEDEDNQDAWREKWSSAFTLGHREVITTSKKLAVELARLAQKIRNRIRTVLEIENEQGPLTKLMGTFKVALIDDLDEETFADMYAQTIAYGLLSARIATPGEGTSDDLASAMPVTNPFLKELMETFLDVGGRKTSSGPRLDFDELGISEVIDLLDASNMEAVVADFGDKNPQEDPVIHFFEGFLQEYDKKIKKARGVFYTPRPVVSFIVRSVDELLRTEFGLEDGLADTTTWGEMAGRIDDLEIPEGATPDQAFVQILDPATGTGTFLVEVIDLIHKTMIAKWQAEGHGKKKIDKLWNDYVPEHLLPRLHGYELMMAPYAIAHMKIGLKLYETGYRFESDERARIYLTNSLEPAQDFSGTLAFAIPALAHEAEAVNAIKRDQRFTVAIGNPPYSGISSNMSECAQRIVDAYKFVDGEPLNERKVWLQDDYVKFIRFCQVRIEEANVGVLGFITNHGYVDNPTFRGMRQSLKLSFNGIRVVDAHGNSLKKERAPDGGIDKNVFDIQQGVAILLAVRAGSGSRVSHADLWGTREAKYDWLNAETAGSAPVNLLSPSSPYYFFCPVRGGQDAYTEWTSLSSLLPTNSSGVITARDDLVLDIEPGPIIGRIKDLRSDSLSDEQLRAKWFSGRSSSKYAPGDSRGWRLPDARKKLREDVDWDRRIQTCLYRPFDSRFVYMAEWMVDWSRPELRKHLSIRDNLLLVFPRNTGSGKPWNHVFVSRSPILGRFFPDSACITYMGPAAVLRSGLFGASDDASIAINEPLDRYCEGGDVEILKEGRARIAYMYAILHSPSYRETYAPSLRADFPRVPTATHDLVSELSTRGGHLIDLHLLEHESLAEPIAEPVGCSYREVEKVSYSDETVWIDKAKTRGFKGVPDEVWNFHIGGYQVCNKWLKDRQAKGGKNPRPGRVLTDEDIEHYQKIVVALSETIRIMAEIDEVIEARGGWPNAFQTGDGSEENSTPEDADDTGASMAAEETPQYGSDE
jgi:predicted helicase